MPVGEHHPWDIKLVSGGVDQSLSEEALGNVDSADVYDSYNMSPNVEGKIGNRVKIKGELLSYETEDDAIVNADYVCLASIEITGRKVELWGGPDDGLIKIENDIVCQSEDLPLRSSDLIIVDGNENTIGGEIYITNRRTTPFILSVKDMLDSTDETYFADFNIDLYTVNIKSPLNRMQFREIVFIGGGSGVPPGAYTYAVRLATKTGDRTNWSPESVVCLVPNNLTQQSREYRSVKTFGADANVALKTGYGVKLKYRVVNEYNFDFIEIKRTPFNLGAGTAFTPGQEIIAKIDIAEGEVDVIEFIDGKDNNIVPSIPIIASDLENQFTAIKKANALRYVDRRLHLLGVTYESRDMSSLTLRTSPISGNNIDPYIMNIGKDGHSDAYNAAYFKSHMRGEKESFSIVGFDGMAGAGLAKKFDTLKNYQLPQRREAISNVTEFWCSTNGRGVVTGASITNSISKVHEVFDLSEAVSKQHREPVNILTNGDGGGGADPEDIGWKPLTPTANNDADTHYHALVINPTVDNGSGTVPYNPVGFSPTYFSLGVMLAGINKTSIPSWMKAFSVLRTPMANRVVTQGIGVYSMEPDPDGYSGAGSGSTKKERRKVWFYSSDVNAGVISPLIIQDIKNNPSRYKVQLVSPLGFFSEVYMGDKDADFMFLTNKDADVDFVSYARCINNTSDINPGVTGYTKFGSWRNTLDASNPVNTSVDKVFDILSVSEIEEGRGVYFDIEIDAYIYDHYYPGGDEFNENKEWHEPFYIINIIQEAAEVQDNNIVTYLSTGHYQKIESLIALSTGLDSQRYELIDERFEDCCPDFYSTTKTTDNVYLFIREGDTEEVWLNVTYKSDADRNTILAAINVAGFYNDGTYDIKGVYTHDVEDDRFYTIIFENFNTYYNNALFIPELGQKIFVVYDTRFPIKVFGGDTFLGESIFAPIDRDTTNGEDTGFYMNTGMPYYEYYWDDDYTIPKNVGPGIFTDNVQNGTSVNMDYIRQWCVMFTSESRCAIQLNHGSCFPNIHYVMRPLKWDQKDILSNFSHRTGTEFLDGAIHERYLTTYPEEYNIWGYGGFKFEEKVNSDYSSNPFRKYFSTPDFEFEERTQYLTRDHSSNQRATNQQFYPGLRSFPPFNIFDADDDAGEFLFGFDGESSDKGNNLYVLTTSGVVILLLGKKSLSDANGNTITYMLSDSAVTGQYWLTKSFGCPGSLFRTAAENGNDLFWCSQEGFKKLSSNELVDINGGYWPTIKTEIDLFSRTFENHYRIHGEYHREREEYWVTISSQDLPGVSGEGEERIPESTSVFVFCENPKSPAAGKWVGRYGYEFDDLLYSRGVMYGMRELSTWALQQGTTINGDLITAYFDVAVAKEPKREKEFIRFAEGSRQKPNSVEFYIDGVLQCSVDQADIKDYGKWEQFIPRKDASVSSTRARLQHDYIIKRVIHDGQGEFEITTSETQYKFLK